MDNESVVISYGIVGANITLYFQIQLFMKKFFTFLKKSNRYKHLLGGFLVGIFACNPLGALYSATVAGSCLEQKDKLHGCPWDWIDWFLTAAGGGVAAIFWLFV